MADATADPSNLPTGSRSATSGSAALTDGDEVDTLTVPTAVVAKAGEDRRLMWARKREKQQRYSHEHNKDPAWFHHKKHVLICSWSGRPIFTRYGDDTALAAYMGVISAIIMNLQKHGDNLRSIVAGDHTFVFLLKGPIYLVCVSSTGESVAQIQGQLSYVYDQILSVLTGSVAQILKDRPQYDLRNLMGGTEIVLSDLISDFNRYACIEIHSPSTSAC